MLKVGDIIDNKLEVVDLVRVRRQGKTEKRYVIRDLDKPDSAPRSYDWLQLKHEFQGGVGHRDGSIPIVAQ